MTLGPSDWPDLLSAEPETPTQAATRYAKAGMRVFPVDMRPDEAGQPRKQPLHGYLWKERATSVVSEVVDDFMNAEFDLGIDNVGVGWALGQDGYVALDLDGDEPEWWHGLGQAAVNPTKRGVHLIFRQPLGRRIGNGVSRFPSQGWGEVRGVGGYIVIWWSDRPGFDVAELDKVAPFPQPEWLTDAGVEAEAVSPAQLEEFKAAHTAGSLGRIKGFQTKLAARVPGASRNLHAVEVACWMARESGADLVPAREAFQALEDWWAEVGKVVEQDSAGRLKTRKLTWRELRGIECWAIGQLTPERIAEVRAKAEAERAAFAAERKAEQDGHAAMFGVDPETGEARFRRYSVKELLAEDRTFAWDIVGMQSRPTYGLDGGELKTLKSYFGMARDIGLAAGVPVLGRWRVPERQRVLVYVAEGGRIPWTRRLERMSAAYGIDPARLDGWLEVIDDVAPLDSALFRDAAACHLRDFAPSHVHLDPLYPFQPSAVSSSQLSEVGAMLTGAHRLCADFGATFWFTAHFNQTGGGFGLKRVSGAGPAEWADSWALLRHASQPDVPGGRFWLRVDVGSRQWGGSEWDVEFSIGRFDADLGIHDGPIKWDVKPAVTVVAAAGGGLSDPVVTAKVKVLAVGGKARKPLTRQSWLARVEGRAQHARAAFDELLADGMIVAVGSKEPPVFEVVAKP